MCNMPIINRMPINSDNDDDHYKGLVKRQIRNNKTCDTARNYDLFLIGSTVAAQQGDGGLLTHGRVVGIGDHNHNNRFCTF